MQWENAGWTESCCCEATAEEEQLGCRDPKNYRPISNLPFLSKIIERIVSFRIIAHMTQHQLHERCQSAYKAGHSTETALVKVKEDILQALDKKDGVLMVLLDLSSAFDTVCHSKLLKILNERIGLCEVTLDWFRSYLTGRRQAVLVGSHSSPSTVLTRGVPQGSVLGPVLFTIYTLGLGDIIRRHGMEGHFYADDTQLYAVFSSDEEPSAVVSRMESCVSSIKTWMATNCLQLNDAKTDVICFSSRRSSITADNFDITVGDATIAPTPSVRNLGVTMDQHLVMLEFIKKTCAQCFLHLRDLSSIWSVLTQEAAEPAWTTPMLS